VYAQQALLLPTLGDADLLLQAVRIGDLGIVAIPNEVYAITGLKIKAQSPSPTTMNIGLANGAFGYIPPPEQHFFGGYTTWPATTAGLEIEAEPKIVDTLLRLLEEVVERPRRKPEIPEDDNSRQVLMLKPVAYWRMQDINWPTVADSSGTLNTAEHEPGIAVYLPGPNGSSPRNGNAVNRAAHYAGGRTVCKSIPITTSYTVEMWIWNGLPSGARETTGHLFSMADSTTRDTVHDSLGVSGTGSGDRPGRLFFHAGNAAQPNLGRREVQLKTWHHIVMVRDTERVRLFVDNGESPEVDCKAPPLNASAKPIIFVGGSTDRQFDFAGRIDEVAIYDRALTPDEVSSRFPKSMK
jgi:hypothetical protein